MSEHSRLNIAYSARADSDLWSRLNAGDRGVLDMLYYQHIDALIKYGNQFAADTSLVDDCIQDLFLDLWAKRSSLSEVRTIRFYLLKSLKHRILRASKKVRSFVDIQVFIPEHNELWPSHESFDEALIEKLKSTIGELSPLQREIIFLKYYNGLSFEEIAEMLDLSRKQLYNAIAKAMSKLRSELMVVTLISLLNYQSL